MAVNVMLDLETLGTGNKAFIMSIGAVKFDQTQILDRFEIGIELEQFPKSLAFEITPATVGWWFDPARDEARRQWLALAKTDIFSALEGFALWYGQGEAGEAIWGNGATFDNVILRSAYEACSMEYPAPFYLDKCYRTAKGLAPEIKLERLGVHHAAVDDAESQARHLQAIAKHLNFAL